ncbi:MAG: hypothetical protein ABL993_08965 [Vicinamibacterales bacterium]
MRTLPWIFLFAFAGIVGYALVSQRGDLPPAVASEPVAHPAIVGTIEDVMKAVVGPSSDVLFGAVATTLTASGLVEKRPQNDEEWDRVEHNALMLAEAMNLITMPGREVGPAAPSADAPASQDAPELTPSEIKKLIDADPGLFARYANALQKAAITARDHAKNRNVAGIVEVGGTIEVACENCHLYYWYPKKGEAPPPP